MLDQLAARGLSPLALTVGSVGVSLPPRFMPGLPNAKPAERPDGPNIYDVFGGDLMSKDTKAALAASGGGDGELVPSVTG